MNSSSATCRKITTTARNSLTVRAPILRPRNGPIVNAVAYAARHISVAVLFVATILGMSCLTSTSQAKDVHKPPTYRDIDYSLSSEEARTVHVLEAMTALWFLAIGCCVGSFLNVVVYRAPLGMDIVVPKSRCPKCQIAINPRDNIPVIGWLRLRGKCRHCQAPISPRYPLVELGVGLLFLAFMYRTLLSGGENLPVRDTDLYHGVIWILWYTKWDLVGVYLFQMALLVALWGGTLMEYDGHRWPRRMVSVVAALGVVAVSLWPRLHPIPLLVPASTRLEPPLGIGLLSGLAGLVVSGGVAYAISLLVYRQRFVPAAVADPSASSENSASSHLPIVDADSRRMQFAVAVGLTGLFLGWQTGLAVAVVIGGLLATHSFFRKYPVAMTSSLVTLLLLVWRPVFHFIWPRVSVFLTHF